MIEASFKNALEQAGLCIRDKIIPDGKLHRFTVQGDKAGSKNGWYILYGDSLPAGAYGSWKTGTRGVWCAKSEPSLSPAEREQFKHRMIEAKAAREAEEDARHKAAREKAASIWAQSIPAPDNHAYLVAKGVKPHGIRSHKNFLVLPLRDIKGTLHSLQFIDEDGNKRFLSGGRKKGCYFPIGTLLDSLCIAEGYATAASVYESTGLPVAVAFDAGNLEPVARALRGKFPEIEITLCADNDTHTQGNPGLTKAREAAAACGGLLAVPPIHGDFNDLYKGHVK